LSKIIPLDPNLEFNVEPIWAATYPPKYRVTEQTLRNKLINKTLLPDLSFTLTNLSGPQAYIAAKADPYGILFGEPNLNRIHISQFAYTKLKHGKKLLEHFLAQAPKSQPIVFGQDQGHIFPGVPTECPELINLLESVGFHRDGDLANDLERDLRDFSINPDWLTPLSEPNLQVKTCSPTDINALEEFFLREFPGRWHYDTVIEKCRTWKEYEDVIALWQGDSIEGFAYTQNSNTTKTPTAGYVWQEDLGPQSGALGPIGVSQRVRGRKLGGALLVAGLQYLQRLGVHQCIIDWTSLVDFYGKYGFRVNRRYQPMTRPPNLD
jgi:GNAT superfamily N-acetyltransferase